MATYNPLDTTKKKFDPYEAVKMIGEYKTGWHSSYNAGDKAKADEYAKKAQDYYKQLRDNGYSDVADALTKTNDVGASYIVKDFLKNNSAPTTETPKPDTTTITGKINDLYGIQKSDREKMAGKYDTLEDYNYNHNPYESEIGKSIMEDYKFKGKTASDNAVASGGADNSGNIDSYAAANANRQQLAFTNAGKQAVLNDFNTRITHAKDILNNLGVYQQNQDKGMQTTIGLHQTEEQRVFENDETKKNNQVDRDVKTSEVTGYVPESMSYANNPYIDENGNVIDPHNTDFSLIENNARKALETETDPQRRKDLEQTIKWALQAREIKTRMPEYSKWRNTTTAVAPDATLTSQVTNKELDNNNAIENKKLDTTKELTYAELNSNEEMNKATNATNVTVAGINASAKSSEEDEVTWEKEISKLKISEPAETFMYQYVRPLWLKDEGDGEDILNLIDTHKFDKDKNRSGYKITKNDAVKLLSALGIESIKIDEKTTKTASQWIEERTWYEE